jgi:hypothetical protein
LPTLAVHRGFVSELLSADSPCCALGLVEERRRTLGLIALRPDEAVPEQVSASGFKLGHCVLGTDAFEVVQLSFQFVGFKTYHVLVNPSSTVAQRVLATMLQSGEYFIIVVGPDRAVQTFRSEVGEADLDGLKANWARLSASATTEAQYRRALAAFRRNPDPPGQVLEWVGGDDVDYLDICTSRLELVPS